jgi:hypothetical protein
MDKVLDGQCRIFDSRLTVSTWLDLIEKAEDDQCLLMLIRALAEKLLIKKGGSGIELEMTPAELIKTAIEKLFMMPINIWDVLVYFLAINSIEARLLLVDKFYERAKRDELATLRLFLNGKNNFFPRELLKLKLQEIQRKIEMIQISTSISLKGVIDGGRGGSGRKKR